MDEDTPLVAQNIVEEHAGQVQPDKPKDPAAEREKTIIDEIRDNFALVTSVEDAQRQAEDEELEFESGQQWLPEHLASRAEHTDETTGGTIPARPALTINLVEGAVQQIISEARQARLALTVKPKAGLANTKMAGYFRGLIRAIQADSGATSVRLWSLERTVQCGRGAYRIETEFADDGDFDLDIQIKRILDQGSVYWDPYAQEADRSDAEWCLLVDWMSETERTRLWPTKALRPTEDAFQKADDPWFAVDPQSGNKRVRVAYYYRVERTPHTLAYHPQLGKRPLTEMPPDLQQAVTDQAEGTRSRPVDARSVRCFVVDGSQILEESQWMGKLIPVMATTGLEKVVRGKRRWKGVVRNVMDPLRGYNVTISSAVELAGSAPRAPYIMYEGQDEGHELMWDESPIRNYTRLYVKRMDIGGAPAPFPQRQQTEPQIQATMFLAQALKADVHSVIGMVDPSFRVVKPYDRSGKAIEALQRQGAAGSSSYLDNIATITMPYEGRVLLDLIPKVYDRPGRIVRVMDNEENDDETAIMIKRPFVLDQDGNPVPVPCPTCVGTGTVKGLFSRFNPLAQAKTCPACQGGRYATKQTMPPEYQGQKVEYVDLSEGQYKVAVSVGRSFRTQQEEAMSAMSDLAQAAPGLVPLYADVWVRAMAFPGSQEIADRIKKQNPAAQDKKGQPEIPPELAQRMQQLVAEHQAAMAELQKATELLKTDAIKTAGQKELQAMKAEAAAGLEHLKQQGKLMEQTAGAESAKGLELLRGELEKMRLESEQHQERLLLLLTQEFNARQAEENRQASEVSAERERAERASAEPAP